MKIVNVPEIFKVSTNHEYPPGNDLIFEEYFYNKFISDPFDSDLYYLPILWTNFYISRNYGSWDMSDLQNFLNSLPRDRKYFTIIQYDDGIINQLYDLDIFVLSSGGVGNYCIPLINKPYEKVERNKDIFASFIGFINGRHKIREKIKETLNGKSEYFISESLGFDKFKETMERSIFSLCPRGYGKTSFRINESLNLGSIPVYIYDNPWIPFNDIIEFEDYGVLIDESQINNLDEILKSIPQEKINLLQYKGKLIYESFFKYESCYETIKQKLIKK